jgi:hypothetical protein
MLEEWFRGSCYWASWRRISFETPQRKMNQVINRCNFEREPLVSLLSHRSSGLSLLFSPSNKVSSKIKLSVTTKNLLSHRNQVTRYRSTPTAASDICTTCKIIAVYVSCPCPHFGHEERHQSFGTLSWNKVTSDRTWKWVGSKARWSIFTQRLEIAGLRWFSKTPESWDFRNIESFSFSCSTIDQRICSTLTSMKKRAQL